MKKILFFLLVLASFTLSAQNEQMWEIMRTTQPSRNVTDVPAENIQFWVGSGSNEVVAAFFFCANPAIGIAYGYRFDGTATILDMWSAINAADPNFTFTYSGPSVTGCAYNNGTIICPNVGGMLMYTVNGNYASGLSDPLVNGDYFEMCEWSYDCTLPTTNIYYPVDPTAPTAVDATIDPDDILYWVGEGDNDVVFVVNWCDTAIAMAWGVHFNGNNITVADILDTIREYDDRFDYNASSGFVNDITYWDGIYDLSLQGDYFMYNVNGGSAMGIESQYVQDGDYIKFGDEMCGIHDDSWNYIWTTTIVPVSNPNGEDDPEDATIAPEDILYWVGTGSNEIIMAINWADPDTCLAWGVRFDGDYITNAQALDSMAVADPRFSFSGASMLDELFFVTDNNDTLRLTANSYWSNNVNGNQSAGINAQLHDGDFSKWGDIAVGIGYDFMDWGGVLYPMSMAWVTPVTPVPAPQDPDPEDATISADDILYWVGTGSNEIIMAINWAAPDTCLAWGVRFDGAYITNAQALDSMAVADPRFSFSGASMLDELFFITDNNDTLRLTANSYWSNNVNGNQSAGINAQLHDGDFSKWGDIAVGIGYDFMDWGGVLYPMSMAWVAPVIPVPAPQNDEPEDATISADNIIYWVGNGDNEVVVAVNWCNPSQAMAWGVRFTGTNAVVADIIHTIELYDSRVNFDGEENGYISNITFADGTHNNYTPTGYWMYNVNGVGAMLGVNQQTVEDGDIIKFGDSGCGIDDGNWNYTWDTPIAPVELPAASTEVFDGIVGSEGCQAIKYDDASILGWATTCVVTRGYYDIADAGEVTSYGTDDAGIGASSTSTADAVSLGDGGSALLTFGIPISNGEGYDFAVFENSLNNTFLELAFVEVSSDGEHFYRFPSVSNTQTNQQIGNGGAVDATKLNNLAGKYCVGYGTPFDLEELAGYSNLDINNVTHVRVVDVVGSINPLYGTTDKNGHLINDPYPTPWYNSGFDLTGVAVMNGWTPTAINNYQQEISFMTYPNPCQNVLNVNNVAVNESVALFNAMGQLIWSDMTKDAYFQIDMQSYPAGIYMLQVGTQMTKIVKK